MRKMLTAVLVACMFVFMSMLSISAVQAKPHKPVANTEGTLTWTVVNFESTRKAGINTIYRGTSEVAANGTFNGTVTDAWVEIWHNQSLNLRDWMKFNGTVDGKSGTLTIRLVGKATIPGIEWKGQWTITGGTGDLANLRGQGSWWGTGLDVEYSGNIQFV